MLKSKLGLFLSSCCSINENDKDEDKFYETLKFFTKFQRLNLKNIFRYCSEIDYMNMLILQNEAKKHIILQDWYTEKKGNRVISRLRPKLVKKDIFLIKINKYERKVKRQMEKEKRRQKRQKNKETKKQKDKKTKRQNYKNAKYVLDTDIVL